MRSIAVTPTSGGPAARQGGHGADSTGGAERVDRRDPQLPAPSSQGSPAGRPRIPGGDEGAGLRRRDAPCLETLDGTADRPPRRWSGRRDLSPGRSGRRRTADQSAVWAAAGFAFMGDTTPSRADGGAPRYVPSANGRSASCQRGPGTRTPRRPTETKCRPRSRCSGLTRPATAGPARHRRPGQHRRSPARVGETPPHRPRRGA